MFKSIHRTRVSDEVVNQIKSLIIDGKLKPGDRLPPERDLIKQFGVSRPSLREALNSLVAMGFLEAAQGNRTVVKSLAAGKMFDPLDKILKEDINSVFELIEVRKAIETWNAYYAAKRATPEDISHLEKILASMRETLEKGNGLPDRQDADFHLAIARATHNKLQAHIMFTLHDMLKESIEKHYHKMDEAELFNHHSGVFEAIRDRNPDLARTRIFRHLDYVETCVRADMESESTSGHSKNQGSS